MKTILIILIIAFGFGNIYAQHIFSVSYNGLSQESRNQIEVQTANFEVPVEVMSMTGNRNDRNNYSFSFQSVQNTKIIILNEETGNNVVITPTADAPAYFQLSPFFLEELRLAVLGDAERYLVIETNTDLSIRNITSVSASGLSVRNAVGEQVFIPRFFYGPRGNPKEALPRDRQIIHIFRERPRFIPAFPDDPENLRLLAERAEEMSYFVYMFLLPDGSKIIHNEHFNPPVENNQTSAAGTNQLFNLCSHSNLTGTALTTTLRSLDMWSKYLAGTVPINIRITHTLMNHGDLGSSLSTPDWFNPETQTWYPSALANQLRGYNIAPGRLDIYLRMNTHPDQLHWRYHWHYSTVGNPSCTQFDWLTIMLHEIAHGLGFGSWIQSDGRYAFGIGGYGQGDFTAFPCIFTRQLYQRSTGRNITQLSQSDRARLITSGNNLYAGRWDSFLWWANEYRQVRMYAPTRWNPGSSVSHWHPNVNFPTFMTPRLDAGVARRTISTREVAIMRDMGWQVHYCPADPIVFNLVDGIVSICIAVRNKNLCGRVNVENVTVINNANLFIEADGRVTLGAGFRVEPGASLSVVR